MTCNHVLGLIDAGPFADYPRAHVDAAWQHARTCATCGPALETATTMTAELATMPRPAPPADMAATIMSRIASLEPTWAAPVVDAATAALPAPVTPGPSSARDWSPWVTAIGGIAAMLALALSMRQVAPAPVDGATIVMAMLTIKASLIPLPTLTTWAAVLAVSLAFYVIGLFAPIGGRSRS